MHHGEIIGADAKKARGIVKDLLGHMMWLREIAIEYPENSKGHEEEEYENLVAFTNYIDSRLFELAEFLFAGVTKPYDFDLEEDKETWYSLQEALIARRGEVRQGRGKKRSWGAPALVITAPHRN